MTTKLIGTHPDIRVIRRTLLALANCDANILIIGEHGVGKTLVGRLIHTLGPHKHLVLRAVNFELVSERELRVVLFGSEPPESTTELQGIIEHPTTCLLRNIEYAPPYIQQRLVLALAKGTYRRTPSGLRRDVKGRFIFTTSTTDFRRPYLSRLIVPVRDYLRRIPKFVIPPLRERIQDIPLLAAYYRKFYLHLSNPALSPDDTLRAPDFSKGYPWHENIIELMACLRADLTYTHADLLCRKERLEFEKMMVLLDVEGDFSLRKSTAVIEHLILQRVLNACGNHRHRAANTLGLSPSSLQRRTRS
jgi:two-component system, NtrC family, response regulator HydG